MTFWRPTFLLTFRAVVQLPRLPAVLVFSMVPPLVMFLIFGSLFEGLPERIPDFPTDNYYEYLCPAIVLFTAIIGIANSGVALVMDFKSGYFNKILLAPVNMWSILFGRLLSDGVRVFVQSALLLGLAYLFGARVETGLAGALLMLAVGVSFAIFTVGVIMVNVALKTKDEQSTQAVFPLFFIMTFLTTAFIPEESIGSDVLKAIINGNPAQYVVTTMQGLMMTGYDWADISVAWAIIVGFAVLGVVLTRLNFRSVYT